MSREALALIEEGERRAAGIEATRAASRWCPKVPLPTQQAFLELDTREAMFGGATRGGKSDALLMGALKYADVPGYNAIIFRRTYADLALADGLLDRAREWLAPTAATWHAQDKKWRFPSGATLSFGYCENDSDRFRYQGTAFQYIGWDELTQWPTDVPYKYLFSRATRLLGMQVPIRVRSATNPGGRGHRWVAKRFGMRRDGTQDLSKAVETDGEARVFVPSKVADNFHVDQAETRASLRRLDSTTREQLEHGRWVEDGQGLIYPYTDDNLIQAPPRSLEEWRQLCKRLHRKAPGKLGDWYYVLAIDLGASEIKPTTAYCVEGWNDAMPDLVFVLQSHKTAGDTPTSIAKEANRLMGDYEGFTSIVVDQGALGAGYGKEFRKRYHIPAKPAEKQAKLGFRKLVRGALERVEILIVEEANADLLEEMQELRWDEDGLDNEPGADNHLTDALLYDWRETAAFAAELPEDEPAPGSAEALAAAERRREEEELRTVRARKNLHWSRRRA